MRVVEQELTNIRNEWDKWKMEKVLFPWYYIKNNVK